MRGIDGAASRKHVVALFHRQVFLRVHYKARKVAIGRKAMASLVAQFQSAFLMRAQKDSRTAQSAGRYDHNLRDVSLLFAITCILISHFVLTVILQSDVTDVSQAFQ